jgi:hypothetical protein
MSLSWKKKILELHLKPLDKYALGAILNTYVYLTMLGILVFQSGSRKSDISADWCRIHSQSVLISTSLNHT